jgi:microcystin-dependent protein
MNQTVSSAGGRRSRKTLLPFLSVLFLIAWAMVMVLIVLQDRMIDAQRDLIHVLFKDNVREVAMKSASRQNDKSAAHNKTDAKRSGGHSATQQDQEDQNSVAQVPSANIPSTQAPLSQVPLSQDAVSQPPSSQVKPKSGDKSGRNSRKMRSPFSRPPAEITDPSDQRRVSISI